MKNLIKLAAVAALMTATPAFAGKGGSATKIRDAIASHSQDAIIAEVERAESLVCGDCVTMVTGLTDDNRYEVRAVAAWWIAKRPSLKNQLATGFKTDLASGDSHHVRNAADFLGRSSTFDSLPQLRVAIKRNGLDTEAKLAIVRAVEHLANLGGNEVLTTAMVDSDAKVRAAAAATWREIRGQKGAAPVVSLLVDGDAAVRAEAATAMGAMRETSAVATLETMVTKDASALVRKNAAWALGKIGAQSSRAALSVAVNDASGLVRLTAKASLSSIK